MTASAPETKPRRRHWLRRTLWILLAVLLALLIKFILHLLLPRNFNGSGEKVAFELSGGDFEVLYYCGKEKPHGIVILGTGDGGWSYWEKNTAKHLTEKGFAVGGWDSRKFADSRKYGYEELCEGFNALVGAVQGRSVRPAIVSSARNSPPESGMPPQ